MVHRVLDLLAAPLRAVVLIVFLVVLAAGLMGAGDAASNIAPVSVYVVFWIGVPVASVLFGPVWRAVSPWETLGRLVSRPSDAEAPRWLRSGWAALVPISIFHWLELAYHDGATPGSWVGWGWPTPSA